MRASLIILCAVTLSACSNQAAPQIGRVAGSVLGAVLGVPGAAVGAVGGAIGSVANAEAANTETGEEARKQEDQPAD